MLIRQEHPPGTRMATRIPQSINRQKKQPSFSVAAVRRNKTRIVLWNLSNGGGDKDGRRDGISYYAEADKNLYK